MRRAKSNQTVKMMLNNEHVKKVVNWTRANVARDFKRQSLRNALLINVSENQEKAAIWRLDECELGGQKIFLQAIPAQMSWDKVLEWVREEVYKDYKNRTHNRGLQRGDSGVHQVVAGSDGEVGKSLVHFLRVSQRTFGLCVSYAD